MKILLIFILIFSFSACSKGLSSRSNFKLVLNNLANDSALLGGAYVETFEISSNNFNLMKLDTSNSSEIPYGVYGLVLVAFSGPNETEGTRLCGSVNNVKLDKIETVIIVKMNSVNCSQEAFSKVILSIKKDKKSFWNKDYWNQSYWGS